MQLGWNGRMWEISRLHKDGGKFVTAAPADMTLSQSLGLHAQYLTSMAPDDPCEKLFQERLEAAAALQYWLPKNDDSVSYGIPGGPFKGVAFPTTSDGADELEVHRKVLRYQYSPTLVLTEGQR